MKKHRKSRKQAGNYRLAGRRGILIALGGVAVLGVGLFLAYGLSGRKPAVAEEVIVFKDPTCECCDRWIRYMRREGFKVALKNLDDMSQFKTRVGVPQDMYSCHTALVGGYLVEGHVPAGDIKRMLAERPDIAGLAVPGMPSSAPGMDSPDHEPYTVYSFDAKGASKPYATY